MFQQNEVVTLILGIGVLVFFIGRSDLSHIPAWKTFLASYALLLLGWHFTVLEDVCLPEITNLLEHICYATSSIVFAIWCWRVVRGRREARE
ncbi:MAG: hypothetical protein ABIG44_12940 [Planctomycetota bacterium]